MVCLRFFSGFPTPYTTMTSSCTVNSPPNLSNAWWSVFRKISDTKLISNGSLFQRYLPYGVSKVVSLLDSSSNTTCQKPLRASIFEKTLALLRLGSTSSMTGRGCLSRLSALFSFLGSRQIRRSPDGLVATTMLLTQSVGSSTGSSTLRSVSLCSSAFNYGFTANGTRLDGHTVGGTVRSTSRCCSPSSLPTSPSNTSLNSSINWSAVFCLVSLMLPVAFTGATCSKFSLCTSKSPMCCITLVPVMVLNSL